VRIARALRAKLSVSSVADVPQHNALAQARARSVAAANASGAGGATWGRAAWAPQLSGGASGVRTIDERMDDDVVAQLRRQRGGE
jgi:hypothetical protein